MMRISWICSAIVLCTVLFGCNKRPTSAIVAKFQQAGGGDASTADVASIGFYLLHDRDLTVQLYNMCQPLFKNPPDSNWPFSDEGKICQAAVNSVPVQFKSDGVKF